jgi:surface glycoprotein (TIGR04207 family)
MSTRKRKHARAVALSLLMILSVVAGSLAVTGAASGTPGGMVGVPSENIESDLPPKTPMGEAAQRIEDKGVLTSKHADTLEVFVTNPGRAKKYTDGAVFGSGPIAIVVRDDVHDAGRRVALPKDVLVDILGHVPEMAYGTHDSGEKWSAETTVEDGYVVVDVPHFSDNVITWSGNFVIEGDPAASGTVYDYEQSNPVSLFTINVTGVVATETDAPSWTGLSSGTTIDPQIAGNLDPASANVTFVGNQYTGSRYTPSGSGDASITVNGDAAPSGPNGGEPEITFTGTKGEWGDVKWSTSAGGELIGAGDRIVVGHRYSETISALYPSDGSVDWTYSMGTDPSFIAVDNTQGQAYITTKTESGVDELHAVVLYTGNNLWTKSLDDNAERIAVNENSGKIVINQDTGIEAYDADGSLLCSEDLGSWPVSSLAVDDSSGRIYVGKGDGSLLVRKSDGSSDFSVWTGMDSVYGLKTDSSAGVFIATSDGVTKAYDLSAGGEQWTYSSGGNNAAIADGIFYTEGGGTLHGIDTSSGSQVRSYSFDAYHIAATNDGVFAGDGGTTPLKSATSRPPTRRSTLMATGKPTHPIRTNSTLASRLRSNSRICRLAASRSIRMYRGAANRIGPSPTTKNSTRTRRRSTSTATARTKPVTAASSVPVRQQPTTSPPRFRTIRGRFRPPRVR